MNLFKYRTWPLFIAYKDIVNFIIFRRNVSKDIKNPNSTFNKLKLKRNWLGNIVYTQISLEDNMQEMPDTDKKFMVVNKLKPVHNYFSFELGVSEYITPRFNNFVDGENNPTLSYGILYIFSPNKFSITWLFKWILILGLLIYGSIKLFSYYAK